MRLQLLMAAAAAANAKLQQASVTEAVVQAVRSSQQSNTESTRKVSNYFSFYIVIISAFRMS